MRVLIYFAKLSIKKVIDILSPKSHYQARARSPKGLCAESARAEYWQTVPPQWGGGRFFDVSTVFLDALASLDLKLSVDE